MTNFYIQRKPEVSRDSGLPPGTLNNRINEGTFPPPIALGDRAVGWISTEVEKTILAMAAGCNKHQLTELVEQMVEKRKEYMALI